MAEWCLGIANKTAIPVKKGIFLGYLRQFLDSEELEVRSQGLEYYTLTPDS